MKNKVIYIVLGILLVIVLIMLKSIFFSKQLNSNNHPIFDNNFAKEATFTNASKSSNFIVTSKIVINYKETKNNITPLQYLVEVNPKTNEIYDNVVITAVLDETIGMYLEEGYDLYFGTDKSQKLKLSSKSNPGIVMSKTTNLKQKIDKDKINSILNKPIKLKISWKNNVEYLLVTDNHIEYIK